MASGSGIRNYSNVFPNTTVVGPIPASSAGASEVYTVNSVTGLPVAPFTAAFNRGQTDEEAVLVTAVNTGTKQVTVQRGYDGTSASAHSTAPQPVTFEHVVVALDFREANAHVNDASVSHAHGLIVAADIAAGAVVAAALGAGAVGSAALAAGAVVQAAVAAGYVDLGNAQIVNGVKTFSAGVVSSPLRPVASDTANAPSLLGASGTPVDYPPGDWPSFTFVAPPSGIVSIHVIGYAENSNTTNSTFWIGARCSTLNEAANVVAGVGACRFVGGTPSAQGASAWRLLSGLTPGTTYTIQPWYQYSSGTTATIAVNRAQIIVSPML